MSTLLPDAASRMKLGKFTEFLRQSDDIEQRDQKGRTALFRVARIGKSDILRLLLDHGADPNAEDSTGEAPLQAASRYGHLECVEMLLAAGAMLDHCPPPEMTDYAETALCSAVRKQPEIAKVLLRHGANPNAASSDRWFPLGMALLGSPDIDLIRMLIQSGADVNALDQMGYRPLHHAIQVGNTPLIRMLLEAGANIDGMDRGEPIICYTILQCQGDLVDVVRSLLDFKPDMSLKSISREMTALELAIDKDYNEVAAILRAAGSPEPASDENDEDEEEDLDDGGGQGLAGQDDDDLDDDYVSFLVAFSHPPIPTQHDEELADEIFRGGPSLCERFGWRASPGHCTALQKCAYKPIPIERVAYYIRGYDMPKGKEMDDGPELLGESYLTAMDRFLKEGLVDLANQAKSLELTYDSDKLKAVAKRNKIKVSGSKAELIRRLIDQIGAKRLLDEMPHKPHYRITEAGRIAMDIDDTALDKIAGILRTELISLLEQDEFKCACSTARDLDRLLYSGSHCRRWRSVSSCAGLIAVARRILGEALPEDLHVDPENEKTIRSIAAAATLSGDSGEEWGIWQQGIKPPRDPSGQNLGVDEFCRCFY